MRAPTRPGTTPRPSESRHTRADWAVDPIRSSSNRGWTTRPAGGPSRTRRRSRASSPRTLASEARSASVRSEPRTQVGSRSMGASWIRVGRPPPARSVGINWGEFDVTPGAEYGFAVAARIPVDSIGSASLAVVFLHGTEVARYRIHLAPLAISLGHAATDPSGGT